MLFEKWLIIGSNFWFLYAVMNWDVHHCIEKRFVADKRCLTSLNMEGCSNLGGFVLCSSSLSTLWLSDLHCLSKMVIIYFIS
ncbi:F-BOX/LRR-REPEAT PROTEIN 17, partial [Salix koriyanagi]